ncbi:MAG: TetR/AcrR family transcriptional regulator [Ferruginibacter sp.]|nr:TetR/AcrR family transcriptional regulator [Ferruginibacter sp.]
METLVTFIVSVVLHPNMTDTDTGLRIRQKAHELFMQYGLRSVSMDDIANSLGISKKTIYLYFADKDELVDAVVESEFQKNERICEYDRSNSVNAVHEIFMAIDMMVEMFSSMNPALIFDMQKYYPKAFLKFHRYKNDFLFNVVRDNILRGIKEGLYRTDIHVDIISRFRVESMMMSFNPEFNSKLKLSMAVIEEELIIHFLFGLVSVEGYHLILQYQQERTNKNVNDAKK